MILRLIIWSLVLMPLPAMANSLPFVDQVMSDYSSDAAPGAGVVVVKDGQVLHNRGYGQADREQSVGVTQKTSFRLASLSKQFIAMGVAILVEQGLMTYEQSLTDLLPQFPEYGRQIKIRHLIHHLSGLYDYEDLIPASQTTQVSDQDVLNLYAAKTNSTRFRPGAHYAYSNGGYVLLGLVIESISGERLDAFLANKIFSPLGMASVMYEGENTPITDRAFGYSQSPSGWRRTDQSITSATRGDGGIYASVSDLILWNDALTPNNPSPIVSDKTLSVIFTSGRLNNGQGCGYGFGWQIDQWRGLKRQSHTGSSIGFRTAIQRYPEQNLMIAVLTNRNGGSPWTIAETIAAHVLKLPASDHSSAPGMNHSIIH